MELSKGGKEAVKVHYVARIVRHETIKEIKLPEEHYCSGLKLNNKHPLVKIRAIYLYKGIYISVYIYCTFYR